MKKWMCLFALVLCVLTGCDNHKPDAAQNAPALDIRKFFSGKLDAWGVFLDMRGHETERFRMTINGSWKDNSGLLNEVITYSDGEPHDRAWFFAFTDDENFTVTSADVIGKAKGTQNGSEATLDYLFDMPNKNSYSRVRLEDRLYKIDDHIVISRAAIRKYGFKTGEMMVVYHKQ